jgi:hypothetical protein
MDYARAVRLDGADWRLGRRSARAGAPAAPGENGDRYSDGAGNQAADLIHLYQTPRIAMPGEHRRGPHMEHEAD